ncbi:MAG: hypothetical protein UY95_C0014G0004 [Parcubacteria group bacterium GW2011_GWA2_56_7]|nr:MAG: hypothetical protein UY95_C0014G0004 [Parcubacteria group bacterium GW2011_GWA2_56_7]
MAEWKTTKLRSLAEALLSLKTPDEVLAFLRDVATLEELELLANRWEMAQRLDRGEPYREIAEDVGVSTATVTRVAHWLSHGTGGYRTALRRQKKGT